MLLKTLSRVTAVILIALSLAVFPGASNEGAHELRASAQEYPGACNSYWGFGGDFGDNSGADFSPACSTHDYCYSGAPGLYRSTCDSNFESDLSDICYDLSIHVYYTIPGWAGNCYVDVGIYYNAVHERGWQYWGGPCYLNDGYPNGQPCGPPPICDSPGDVCRVAKTTGVLNGLWERRLA